jgi:hypothetical protein
MRINRERCASLRSAHPTALNNKESNMAIFIRRDIQAAVNSLSVSLSRQQIESLVDRLNGPILESLAAEWEVIVLSALCKSGRITHEKDHGGKTKPDVLFQDDENVNLEFLTDIRAVSDKYLHQENPYDEFCNAIRGYLQQKGHSSAGIYVNVEHSEDGENRKRKIRLTLPAKDKIDTFVALELDEFLSEIAHNPNNSIEFNYDKNNIRFSIRYDANENQFTGGGHISYTVPYSNNNPLKNALRKKGEQLIKSGYKGIKGIIICDGGCDALKEKPHFNSAYGCQEIVEEYLKTHNYILWVLVLRIKQTHNSFPPETKTFINPTLYWNPTIDKPICSDTVAALSRMVNHLPMPETTPINAIHWLNSPKGKGGSSFFGGYSMSGNKIKISARALTELLAGRIDSQKFIDAHTDQINSLRPKDCIFPFFENQITRGNILQNAYIEKSNHKDDDWIVFEYDGPDPAIGPFRVPD